MGPTSGCSVQDGFSGAALARKKQGTGIRPHETTEKKKKVRRKKEKKLYKTGQA